jgi:non-specific serine/threonine protein kinase/serine/threonine-protein kinase
VPSAPLDELSVFESPGAVIGPYKLLEQIGEGGMGVVYMAEQTRPMRREVALKIIKPGMDTRQVIARFEAERQALALMDHPNIARVLDAGATESGRPYFVMELVRGTPITDYCDREQLSITERLDLFVLVCRAVQHAHQKGIIHRDLKPSNILVTVIDGVAVPKVIDFGVAKATSPSLTERTLLTRFHQFVGTPLYMSPEQADLSGMDVDTRSDIYSLGVLLYELLTGTTPFDSETLERAAFDEMRRIIREQEPQKPSLRLSSLGETLTTVSGCRGSDPRRLNRTVRGELDWIAMKALEKDRRRRYETATDFAADVMRYLTGHPVEACPPSASYRLEKYARRNQVALTTVTLVGLALIAGTGVSLWQAGVARKAQRRATTEAAAARRAESRATAEALAARRAQRQAEDAEAIARAVNEFLQEDLLGNAAGVSQPGPTGSDLKVKEALDRAAARIGQRFQGQPLVEAAIRTTIGNAYRVLEQSPSAVPHLERAVALRTAHLGRSHPETLSALYGLYDVYLWSGRWPEALELISPVLQSLMARLGPDHPETLEWTGRLINIYEVNGQWDTSHQLLEDLLERQTRVIGPAHPSTFNTMHALARNGNCLDRLPESMAMHQKLLEGLEAAFGDGHEATIWPRMTYAQVCLRLGDLDRADRLLDQALGLQRELRCDYQNRMGVASILGFQAEVRLKRREYAAAEPLAREASASFEKLQPGNHRGYYWLGVQGAALCGQQRYSEAERLLLQSYEGMKRQEDVMPAMQRRRMSSICQALVQFYEIVQQPEEARAWRQVLSASPRPVD